MTLAQLADRMRAIAARAATAPEIAAEHLAPILVEEARGILGTMALRDLLPATQAERERLGYPRNEPLVREGDYRDTIEGGFSDGWAYAGSTSVLSAYFEWGTPHMRPFAPMALARDAALPQALAIAVEVARETLG